MSNLVVVTFEDEATAFEMRAELVKMQKEYLIEMEDAVVVTKDDQGKVKLHQATNLTMAGSIENCGDTATARSASSAFAPRNAPYPPILKP